MPALGGFRVTAKQRFGGFPLHYPCLKEQGTICFFCFLLQRAFRRDKNSSGGFASSISLPLYQRSNANSTVTYLTTTRGL